MIRPDTVSSWPSAGRRPASRRIAEAVATGALALALAGAVTAADEDPAAIAPGRDVVLETASGEQPLSLGDFAGRYVVLHFGTSW